MFVLFCRRSEARPRVHGKMLLTLRVHHRPDLRARFLLADAGSAFLPLNCWHFLEDAAHGQGETGQHVAAIESVGLGEGRSLVWGGVDSDSALGGIDEPD